MVKIYFRITFLSRKRKLYHIATKPKIHSPKKDKNTPEKQCGMGVKKDGPFFWVKKTVLLKKCA